MISLTRAMTVYIFMLTEMLSTVTVWCFAHPTNLTAIAQFYRKASLV